MTQRTKQDLEKEIHELNKEAFDLIAKVIELINIVGWDDDDTYTFKDGDRWAKFDPDPKITRTGNGY